MTKFGEPLKNFRARALAAMFICWSSPAAAVLTIEVTQGMVERIPIAVVPFGVVGGGAAPALSSSAVISADLARSGRFELIARGDFLSQPHHLRAVKYKDWRLLKADALVIGSVTNIGNDQFEVRFRLLDVFREQQLAGRKFVASSAQLRKVAHQISDLIYQKLLDIPGAFDTRIAYVATEGTPPGERFLLQVADSDGHRPQTILASPQPIISPAWSPRGDQLAYVSFENNRSVIYIQHVHSGERRRVAEYRGINGAPAWSPRGDQLALTLSKEGNAEIYIHDLSNGALRRLTQHAAVDTEPDWSPDGNTIAFTSNRSGTPQIYQIAARGGRAQRLTFDGKYNAGAGYSSDGKSLALITNQGNGFRVGIYSERDRKVRELTQTRYDESPSFAPNDEMILYATQTKQRYVLAAVSPDGQVQQVIQLKNHLVREPAWSPFRANRL